MTPETRQTEKIICERCGENFACGASDSNCWCFTIDLGKETLAQLRDKFEKCLCRSCLAEVLKNDSV